VTAILTPPILKYFHSEQFRNIFNKFIGKVEIHGKMSEQSVAVFSRNNIFKTLSIFLKKVNLK